MFFNAVPKRKHNGWQMPFAFCLLSFAFCLSVFAQPAAMRPPVLRDVGIDQLLNNQIPLDLEFTDETGRKVKLQEYFTDKPVLLTLVYYDCPQLCNQVLTGAVGALKALSLKPGKDFTWVTVSFDPREQPALAAAKKDSYVKMLGKEGASAGWHFLTGQEEAIKALTRAVGFRFLWDPVTKQYAHASGIMIATPQGKLSRYFYGIEYAPRDLRFGLIDASANKIGSLADQIILYCYRYDPTRATYGLVVTRLMQLFAAATIAAFIALYIFLYYKTKRKEAAWQSMQPHNPDIRI